MITTFNDFLNKKQVNLPKVFLGGTCNNSTWRNALIELLKIDYFNPVVDDWTPEQQDIEIQERKHCDFVLYVITPKMTGVYSIAELIDDSNKKPNQTIFCYLLDDKDLQFSKNQIKSLDMVGAMVQNNGGHFLKTLNEVADFLNSTIGNS